jgi:hydroxyacylglutathione hydrolase
MVIGLLVGYFGTNCYIYAEDNGCLVIDPGGDAEKIIRRLESSQLTPDGIIHTHGHLDHSMAAGALQEHFSSRHVPIAVHRKDAGYFGAGAEEKSRSLLRSLGLGDTLFAGGVGRTDLPGGSTEALLRNIRTKLLTLPRETVVYPGHGPETTIEQEKDENPFL